MLRFGAPNDHFSRDLAMSAKKDRGVDQES
jgi:hypothetical protein